MPSEIDVQFWTTICSTDITSGDCLSEVLSLLNSQPKIALVRSLQGCEAQRLIDVLDQVLELSHLDGRLWLRGLRLIRKVSGTQGIVPSSYVLREECIPVEVRFEGSSTAVSDGIYQGRTVAIKRLKGNSNRIFKMFCREVVAWKHLSHRNILPLLGVFISAETPSCSGLHILTEWMANGNVMRYAKSNPTANRLQLLSEVISGVVYLHDLKIVHGDLKGANILVDGEGVALLADFGLVTMTDLSAFLSETAGRSYEGTLRWMSPELLDPDGSGSSGRPTRESDRYALGMVIYEVLTGLKPFHDMENHTFFLPLVRGKRPEKPPHADSLGFSDNLWGLVQLCWSPDRSSRPAARELLLQLSLDSPNWDPPAEYPVHVPNTTDYDFSGSSLGSPERSTGEA